MKTCPKCQTEKTREDFYRCTTAKDGLQGYCRDCAKASRIEWGNTPEGRELIRENDRARYPGRRGSQRDARLQRKYGMSTENYDEMLRRQGGGCAICGTDELSQNHSLPVDHDHDTGRVRGILCVACNHAIGKLQDSPDLLRKAAVYIERGAP